MYKINGFKLSIMAIALASSFNAYAANQVYNDSNTTLITNSDEFVVDGERNVINDSLSGKVSGKSNSVDNAQNVLVNGNRNTMMFVPNGSNFGLLDMTQIGNDNYTNSDNGVQVGSRNRDTSYFGGTQYGYSNQNSGNDSSQFGRNNQNSGENTNQFGSDNINTADSVNITGNGNVNYLGDSNIVGNQNTNGISGSVASGQNNIFGSYSTITGQNSSVIGNSSSNSGNNAVVLGNNINNTRDNTVNVGNKTISNVGDAIDQYDAVNLKQLQQGLASVSGGAAYDDTQIRRDIDEAYNRIGSLQHRIGKVERKLSQGIAAVASMATAPWIEGKTTVAVNGATYNGEVAMGASFTSSIRANFAVTGGVAIAGSNPVARIGVMFAF